MLMQNFKSATDLGLTDAQLSALQKTLVLLETGKLVHVPTYDRIHMYSDEFTGHFNMKAWGTKTDCGTVHCIGGTAEAISGVPRLFRGWEFYVGQRARLRELFAPDFASWNWDKITPTQAARALRSYLTTGDANWAEAAA